MRRAVVATLLRVVKMPGPLCTARQRKMAQMAADIQRVLRKELCHLTGSAQDERVDDRLEKAMANYEELRQVDKDHREMNDG